MQDYKQALALMYLEQQDLTDKTPSELYDMYKNAYGEIDKCADDDILNTPFSQF